MKTVLITGTNRGIGKQFVIKFAQSGYKVFAHARHDSEQFKNFIAELQTDGYDIKPVFFDMLDAISMKTTVNELIRSEGSIDVLVNNAGVAHGGLFCMTKIQTIKDVFAINLFSYMELTQLVLRAMMRKKMGCIINMASIAGIDLHQGNSAYGVSKAAVIAWTKTLANETAPYGIRVNAIAPGLTDTEMAKQMEKNAGEQMIEKSAMKRLARPDEIANVAVFLASDSASFVNGQTLRVDGGG